jgi:hypothetical protein
MHFKTANCQKYNHPEFFFSCDTQIILQIDVDWLIGFLEGEVQKGIKFSDGETMQLGWMLTKLQLMDDGYLHILEPDMKEIPIQFIDSVTNTLRHFRHQGDIVESCYGRSQVNYPSIRAGIIVCNSYPQSQNVYMSKAQPEGNMSGLFFRDLGNDNENDYITVSLYEFACNRPDFIKFLALPIGSGVHKSSGDIIRVIDADQEIPIKSDSFLDQLNRYMFENKLL